MIVDSPEGWFYYAKLDHRGEYTATDAKVGIDKPPAISKDLKRSQSRIDEIEAERNNYFAQLEILKSSKTMERGTSVTRTLGVVLVDFPTSRKRITTYRPNGYFKYEFENMIFSMDYFHVENPRTGQIISSPHPETEKVYGSLKYYYDDQSIGLYEIVGKNGQSLIVNPPDPNNPDLPEWLELNYEMSVYEGQGSTEFMNNLYNEAVEAYGVSEMASYDVICFIYGGTVRLSGNFRPKSRYNKYCMGEFEYYSFAHIGTHAHEYAHSDYTYLGGHDEYLGNPDFDPKRYCLMSIGNYNGPLDHGACPAPFSPYYRIEFGWVTPEIIVPNVTNKIIEFGDPDPNLYVVNIPNSNEYFILETRRGTGFDQYTPRQNGNNALPGVLIWHINPDSLYDYVELEYADNNDYLGQEDGDRFPYPLSGTQNFNNTTTPSSRLRDSTYSSISIDNIDWSGFLVTGYAEVDVLDLPPATPENFNLTGQVGGHPTLSWDANTELDLDGYNLYQQVDGSGYSLYVTLDRNSTSFTDNGVIIGNSKFDPRVCYYIKAFDVAGNESEQSFPRCTKASGISKELGCIDEKLEPDEYHLFDAYPNPFNTITIIKFAIPEETHIKLSIYNIEGKKIVGLVNSNKPAGYYEVKFDAKELSSGIYIYKIEADNFINVKKMILVK